MNFLFALALTSFLLVGGCAAVQTQMINDAGQTVNCDAAGFGLIGTVAALASADSCVQKYKSLGYREAGSPSPSGASSKTANDISASTTTSVVESSDGAIRLTLPPGWVKAPTKAQAVLLYVTNPQLDLHLQISAINTSDTAGWQAFTEASRAKVISNHDQASSSEFNSLTLSGNDAKQGEVWGLYKGVKAHYLLTYINLGKKILYIVAWCYESKFDGSRSTFKSIIHDASYN